MYFLPPLIDHRNRRLKEVQYVRIGQLRAPGQCLAQEFGLGQDGANWLAC